MYKTPYKHARYLEMQYHALSDRLMIVADQASITDGHPCLPSEGQIFTPLQNTKIVGILISHFFTRDKAGKASRTALHKSNAPLVMALCGSKGHLTA